MHHKKPVSIFYRIAQVMGDHHGSKMFFFNDFIRKLHDQGLLFLGSKAAVCSSRMRNSMGVMVDMSRAMA